MFIQNNMVDAPQRGPRIAMGGRSGATEGIVAANAASVHVSTLAPRRILIGLLETADDPTAFALALHGSAPAINCAHAEDRVITEFAEDSVITQFVVVRPNTQGGSRRD